MRILRVVFKLLLAVVIVVILFGLISIAPVDREPVQNSLQARETLARIEQIRLHTHDADTVSVGFGKISITPNEPVSTAGYGNRKGAKYTSVHDSVFVRALVFDNGVSRAAVVSGDLLIIPPTVVAAVKDHLSRDPNPILRNFSIDNIYFGATHTHNSVGNWGEGATEFLYGDYEPEVVSLLAERMVAAIAEASRSLVAAKLSVGSVAMPDNIQNRLIDNGPEDDKLRWLLIERQDSSRLILTTFAAHATCLSSKDIVLSGDYPGKLVNKLEEDFDFAMFMAGAVGSQKCEVVSQGWPCVDEMSAELNDAITTNISKSQPIEGASVNFVRIPLSLPDPQVKITKDLKVRSWLFRYAFGEYPAFVTGLRVGDLIMLGAPGDLSAEFSLSLDSLAQLGSKQLLVTSFNGGYIGYVTPSKYFDVDHYETRLMNWYPPGNGEYVSKCLKDMLLKLSEN